VTLSRRRRRLVGLLAYSTASTRSSPIMARAADAIHQSYRCVEPAARRPLRMSPLLTSHAMPLRPPGISSGRSRASRLSRQLCTLRQPCGSSDVLRQVEPVTARLRESSDHLTWRCRREH
jgi:hypothetical protein